MLARPRRLPLERLLAVKTSGHRLGAGAVTGKWLAAAGDVSRAVVLVSKSELAKSSDRNKLKRRGRAIVASRLPAFQMPVDLILWLGRPTLRWSFAALEEKIVSGFQQAKIL